MKISSRSATESLMSVSFFIVPRQCLFFCPLRSDINSSSALRSLELLLFPFVFSKVMAGMPGVQRRNYGRDVHTSKSLEEPRERDGSQEAALGVLSSGSVSCLVLNSVMRVTTQASGKVRMS